MSVTTTQNPRTYGIVRTLADYELHHSKEEEEQSVNEVNTQPPSSEHAQRPLGSSPVWETQYRRVPPYRPVDPELDFDSRNITLNRVETFFIFNMFGGISMVEVSNLLQSQR